MVLVFGRGQGVGVGRRGYPAQTLFGSLPNTCVAVKPRGVSICENAYQRVFSLRGNARIHFFDPSSSRRFAFGGRYGHYRGPFERGDYTLRGGANSFLCHLYVKCTWVP